MNDPIRRGLRTVLWCITAAIPAIPALAYFLELPAGTVAAITTLFTTAVGVVTTAVNSLEDAGTIPAVLKAPTPPDS